jgi:membrane fusion protein (multidrug efflux system)
VEIVLQRRVAQPSVSEEALVATRDGYALFVVEEGEARLRPVEVGLRRVGHVEILSGVGIGRRVVRHGHENLTDGQPVEFAGSATKPATHPATGPATRSAPRDPGARSVEEAAR